MSNLFTLDSLREEADKEFAPFKIPLSDGTQVTLRNLLRLSKPTRESVLKALDSMGSDEEDGEDDASTRSIDAMIASATKVLDLVSDSNGKKLLKEIDGDIALLLQVIKSWMAATQLGEADSSPS